MVDETTGLIRCSFPEMDSVVNLTANCSQLEEPTTITTQVGSTVRVTSSGAVTTQVGSIHQSCPNI